MIYNTITISLLIEKPFYLLSLETTKLFISNSVRVYTDTFIDTLSQGWAFDSLFCSDVRIFVHNDCPGRRVFAPSSRAQGLSGGGGGGLDEIDTCTSHRHVKSDMARPTSVDQVIHASLTVKCEEFFQLQSSYR